MRWSGDATRVKPFAEQTEGKSEMARGTVKWFSNQKGYGFITPDGGKKDVFVHHSSIMMDGYKTLTEGDIVTFEVTNGPKGEQASNVEKV